MNANIADTVLQLLVLAAGIQGLVIASLLMYQEKNYATRLLGVFFILISLGCLEFVIEGMFYPPRGPELPFPLTFKLAYVPALYLHLRYLCRKVDRFHTLDLVHFAPSILFDFLSFYFLVFEGNTSGLGFISDPMHMALIDVLYHFLFYLQFPYYLLLSYRLVEKDDANSRYQQEIDLWIRQLRLVIGLFAVGWLGFKVSVAEFGANPVSRYCLHSTFVVVIYWLGYSALLVKKEVFRRHIRAVGFPESPFNTNEILVLIKKSGIYRSKNLSLSKVADAIGYSENAVSRSVNQIAHQNFNSYINQLRVEEFVVRAKDPQSKNLSLYGIAQEVGFSSKSSFYRAFKSIFGRTPKDYLKLDH